MVGDQGRGSARSGDLPAFSEHLPALRPRQMGQRVAQEVRDGRYVYVRKRMVIVRYADDFVLGFQYQKEAQRFLEQLQERLREFGLELHPDKTRLIEFGRFAAQNRQRSGAGKPETFNFLGFTHICGTVGKTGRFIVRRRTIGKRLAAKLKSIKVELRRRMHEPIA